MGTYKQAKDFFLQEPVEIFYQTLDYVCYSQDYLDKTFGHDILATVVAAFSGRFNPQNFNDPKIQELLDLTQWGYYNWGAGTSLWLKKYAITEQDKKDLAIIFNAIDNKSQAVYELFGSNQRRF